MDRQKAAGDFFPSESSKKTESCMYFSLSELHVQGRSDSFGEACRREVLTQQQASCSAFPADPELP